MKNKTKNIKNNKDITVDKTNEQHISLINVQISNIGLFYDINRNSVECRLMFKNVNSVCSVDFANIGVFVTTLFDINNSQFFISSFNGAYIRIIESNGAIIGLMHILDNNRFYMFNKTIDRNQYNV